MPKAGRSPVRLKDIAEDLGVSLMTVSRALRNHSEVGQETRERVLKRMRELNYQPDWIARSMVTGRSYLVGLLIPDLMHSFFAEIAMSVSKRLQPLGYQVVIANTEEKVDAEIRHVDVLLGRKVDGLLIASAQRNGNKTMFRLLERNAIPFVLIDRMVDGLKSNYVGANDEEIGMLATSHLIEQGCRLIAHIKGPAISTGLGRLRGFEKAMEQDGRTVPPEYIVRGDISDSGGYEGMRALLQLNPRPDGVFCYSDPVAAGAMKAISEAGLTIPGDIAIIGAGNVHYSDLLRVPLSTVDQSCSQIGDRAAELLVHAMDKGDKKTPQRVVISPKLVIRESSLRSPEVTRVLANGEERE